MHFFTRLFRVVQGLENVGNISQAETHGMDSRGILGYDGRSMLKLKKGLVFGTHPNTVAIGSRHGERASSAPTRICHFFRKKEYR